MRRSAFSTGVVPAIAAILSPAALQASRRGGLVMHTPKSDIVLGRFSFMDQYNEFRNRSGRAPDYYVEKYRDTYWRVDEYIRRAEHYIQSQGFFYLPTLEFPWYRGCLPLLSSYQIRLHYGRHHRGYVEKLNQLIEGTPLYGSNLDEIILRTHDDVMLTGVYNNAAQHYNHCFFWKCIQPYGSNIPPDLKAAVEKQYGSVEEFERIFTDAALNLFGSGWVYWVYDTRLGQFDILSLSNAGCPLTNTHVVPLLCVDVWEHTYYVDYENNRAAFLAKYFNVVDWHWAERHWKRATGQEYYEMKFW
ncbi:superoxide dismutase, putative [Trypanosoma cruzi]|nr:superoxide dismutase, putative [Trypanosoma cruzi]